MWLISTSRGELSAFGSPESVPGGYAILSHVWDTGAPGETTFQQLKKIEVDAKEAGVSPRELITSPKLRSALALAEKHGYRWLWVDTCCIDKTSSAELSEAINSMFRYYSLSDICYAYLGDVPAGDIASGRKSAFRNSRWHKRGWTLQELVAPKLVLFVAQDWSSIGTKAELAVTLEEVTTIPQPVLWMQQSVQDVSIAQRMSWASSRKTTRLEDEAYSLMGIFGIHMPPIYGEGEQAFRRLQEEIIKTATDTSLFSWGIVGYPSAWKTPDRGLTSANEAEVESCHIHLDRRSYLLAPSPTSFRRSNAISFRPDSHIKRIGVSLDCYNSACTITGC